MRTFVYKGTGTELKAHDATLVKGQPFQTDDPAVIGLLIETKDVEEVMPKEEEKKAPRKSDADKS